jgi:hypothetical protein
MLSSTYSLLRSIGKGAQALLQLPVVLLPAQGEFGKLPNVGPMGGWLLLERTLCAA